MDLTINVGVTLLLAYRLFMFGRAVPTPHGRNNTYASIIYTVVESGLLFSAATIVVVALYLSGSSAVVAALDVTVQIAVRTSLAYAVLGASVSLMSLIVARGHRTDDLPATHRRTHRAWAHAWPDGRLGRLLHHRLRRVLADPVADAAAAQRPGARRADRRRGRAEPARRAGQGRHHALGGHVYA